MHYAWKILITASVLYFATMGCIANAQGIYYQPIIQEMGWTLSQYTITTIFNGLAAVAMLPFVDKIYDRLPLKVVLMGSLLGYAGTFALRGAMHSILGFCIIYAIQGASSAFILYVAVPMLINAWFEKRRAFALGIALMTSGFGGFVMNYFGQLLIDAFAWRIAIALQAAISVAITAPLILLFAVRRPEDIGMEPYGHEEYLAEQMMLQRTAPETAPAQKKSIDPQYKKRMLILCIAISAILNFVSVFPQHMPSYALDCNATAMVGATLASVNMLGNCLTKAGMGFCIDKFGQKPVFFATMLLVIVSLILMCLGKISLIPLYIGCGLYGLVGSNNTLIPPETVRTISSGEEFTKDMSYVTMGTMFANAFAIYFISWMRDLTSSYIPVFVVFMVIQAICTCMVMFVFKKAERT